MSGILRLESLTKGNTLKQGDKTPLKYRLFDADGEKLNIAGKSAKVRLAYPDFLTIGYEKDGLTVAQDDTVTFTIDNVIPSRIYHVEIIVDDKFIFPSRADESKFTVDKSSLGTETNIIEIVGKDVLIQAVKSQVDTELQPLVTSLESAQQAELDRQIQEESRETAERERQEGYQEYNQELRDIKSLTVNLENKIVGGSDEFTFLARSNSGRVVLQTFEPPLPEGTYYLSYDLISTAPSNTRNTPEIDFGTPSKTLLPPQVSGFNLTTGRKGWQFDVPEPINSLKWWSNNVPEDTIITNLILIPVSSLSESNLDSLVETIDYWEGSLTGEQILQWQLSITPEGGLSQYMIKENEPWEGI